MKKNIVCSIFALLLAFAVSQPSYAHTVSPVNPNAQPTTKESGDELARPPAQSDGKPGDVRGVRRIQPRHIFNG